MDSRHFAEPLRERILRGRDDLGAHLDTINVKGSRYSLMLEDLKQEELMLPLCRTRRWRSASAKADPRAATFRGKSTRRAWVLSALPGDLKAEDRREIKINLVAKLNYPTPSSYGTTVDRSSDSTRGDGGSRRRSAM